MGEIVSVIVPVYNVEKYVEKCLASILKQTYTNLEIIVVDDGSTDNSYMICQAIANRDSRVKLIHKENGGLSDARNAGLEIATGRYIGFVDSDDFIEPTMYQVLLESCIKYDADICTCARYMVDQDTGNRSELFSYDIPITLNAQESIKRLMIWDGVDSAAWDKLYKRELFDGMRYPYGVLHEDLNFTVRLFEKCKCICLSGVSLYNYLLRSTSICRKPFSFKKYDLIEQSSKGAEFVRQHYPELNDEADYFQYKAVKSYLLSAVCSDNLSLKDKFRVLKNIQGSMVKLHRNKYIGRKERLNYLKLLIKLFLE